MRTVRCAKQGGKRWARVFHGNGMIKGVGVMRWPRICGVAAVSGAGMSSRCAREVSEDTPAVAATGECLAAAVEALPTNTAMLTEWWRSVISVPGRPDGRLLASIPGTRSGGGMEVGASFCSAVLEARASVVTLPKVDG